MGEMSDADKKLLENIRYLETRYCTYDLPIEFEGFTLYPVKMQDYNEFLSASSCLTLIKNDDIMGIKKTYLEYLLSKINDPLEGAFWSMRLSTIAELCFHVTSCLKCYHCGKVLSYDDYMAQTEGLSEEETRKKLICDCGNIYSQTLWYKQDEESGEQVIMIDNKKLNNAIFNKLRKVIMYQNLPDYKDDSWVDKAIRDDQAAKQALTSKNSGKATLERQITCFAVFMRMKPEEVYNMSMRKFLMMQSEVDDYLDYTITRQGLMSGFASLPKGQKLEHWIYKKEKDIYGESVSLDSFADNFKH